MRKTIRTHHRWLAPAIGVILVAALAPVASIGPGSAQTGPGLTATRASPTIDGNNADWAAIAGLNVVLKQFDIPAGSEWEYDAVAPKNAVLKVALDGTKIYVLLEVEDTYNYVATNHDLSAALGVMFRVQAAAGPHMGAGPADFETGLGMVDIWHWELDCGPGAMSGVGPAGSGNDPDCNLDDEYATDPESREDDNKAGAENSIQGSWTHTAGAIGGAGKWIFEMSRPLNTGDSTDAQFAAGGVAYVALAYWDPKESAGGWSDAGHVTSADLGWIVVSLPAAPGAPATTPAVPGTGSGGLAEAQPAGGYSETLLAAGAVLLLLTVSAAVAAAVVRSRK